jgi:DNA-binding beta-propeller fold protein YncE
MACCNGHSTKENESCIECESPQLARNHYFTGKLLVERDFTDEQRFFLGKERRHNQRLHGWGTVCGLKVVQHPNPACQKQFVVIEPGTAIDCCGHEILVRDEVVFDFENKFREEWKEANGQNSEPDNQPHKMQICIRYRECGSEPVPSLFDECGCDDAGCQPNRVLEGYALNVIIDAKDTPKDPLTVKLQWNGTFSKLDHPKRILLVGNRLYVLTAGPDAAIFSASTKTGGISVPQSFPKMAGLDLAMSPDGKSLYLGARDTSVANADPVIMVLDPTNLATPPSKTITLTKAGNGEVRLAVGPDGSLFATNPLLNRLFAWDNTLKKQPDIPVGKNPVAVDVSDTYLYTANNGDATFSAVKLADTTKVTTTPVAAGAQPVSISVAKTTGGDNLALVDTSAKKLYLIGWRPDAVSPNPTVVPLGNPVTGFANTPVSAVYSPAGKWVYVLEQDSSATKKVFVQPLDAHAVELKLPNVLGTAIPVGENPLDIIIAPDGKRLYVSYDGDGVTDSGAVAVIEVTEEDCKDIFREVLDPCPNCAQENCLVLATVTGYVFGSAVTDPVDPSAIGPGELDNWTDRQILPSTQLIKEVVDCLLENSGASGAQGPQGDKGDKGDPGPSALDPDLTHICGINWDHGKVASSTVLGNLLKMGILIAFDRSVRNQDIHDESFLVLFSPPVSPTTGPTRTWVELRPRPGSTNQLFLTGAVFNLLQPAPVGKGCVIASIKDIPKPNADLSPADVEVNGALFVPAMDLRPGDYRVVLKGDFVEDARKNASGQFITGKAVDGDHLPPWVPQVKSGDQIQGGTFESWFTIKQG